MTIHEVRPGDMVHFHLNHGSCLHIPHGALETIITEYKKSKCEHLTGLVTFVLPKPDDRKDGPNGKPNG